MKAKKSYQYLINMCFTKSTITRIKKVSKRNCLIFLQAIEDSSGLKILVQYELEEAQRNQNKKKSTYKETSDIYSEW